MRCYLFFLGLLFCCACKSGPKESASNTVNIRLKRSPQILNPIRSTARGGKQVEWQLFMPLLQFDAQNQELYPVLAAQRPKVETIREGIFQGGRKYTFELREQAKWDNGQPVLAKDVVFTLKAFLHPEIGAAGLRAFLGFIKEVEIDSNNPRLFSVYTDRAINLAEAVIGTMAIYPQYHYDPSGLLDKYAFSKFANRDSIAKIVEKDTSMLAFSEQFIQSGTATTFAQINACGPYQVEEWVPEERIILIKKANWWADDLVTEHQSFQNYPDRLIYHFIKDDVTLATMLKNQQIDVASAIDPKVFDDLKNNELIKTTFKSYTPPSPSYYFIAFNTKNEKLSSPETRKAISHLLDMGELIKVAMSGYAIRTNGPILPSKSYYNQSLQSIDLDYETAAALLKQNGWQDRDQDGILDRQIDGQSIDFKINFKYSASDPIAEKTGVLLKNNAQKAGLLVNLVPLENQKLIEDTRQRNFDLFFSGWSQMPGLDDLSGIWHTNNDRPKGLNKTGFGNAQTDALIDSINIELDASKRQMLYHEIQKQIYEAHPYIFLFVPTERILIHQKFETDPSAVRPGYFENTFRLVQ